MSLRLLRHKPMFSNNDRYFAMANDFWFKLDDSMVDLPVSPHYWNPKTLSCYAVRRGQDCGWCVKRCL